MAYTDYYNTVQKAYIGYYQRPADPAGEIYWASKLDAAGGNLSGIISAFSTSAESTALYGTITSSNISTVVTSFYNSMFGRAPETAGLNFWVNGFTSGQFTAGNIMLNILNAAQGEDLAAVNNKVTAANLFTKTIDPELDGRSFQATYSGDVDAGKGRTFLSTVTWNAVTIPNQSETTSFIKTYIADTGDPIATTTGQSVTLTPNVESFVGTAYNDTFNAGLTFNAPSGTFIPTLQNGDSLDGGVGTDTLTIGTNIAAATTVTPTLLKDIEVWNVEHTGAAALTLNALNATGVTTINNTNATNNFLVTNLASAPTTLSMTSTGACTETITMLDAALAGTADTVAVALSGLTAGAALTLRPTTATASGYETVALTASGSAANTLTNLLAFNTTKLTVAGSQNLTIVNDLNNGLASDGSEVTTVDASAFTGRLNVNFTSGAVSVTGGTGNDTITLGAGYTTADTINGGAGTDTLSLTSAMVVGTTATQSNVSNIEAITISDAVGAGTVTMGAWGATNLTWGLASAANMVISYTAGTNALAYGSATAPSVITGTLAANVAGVATTDVLNLTLNGGNHAGNNITTGNFETLNIASNTAANILGTITMTPTAAQESIGITGAQNLTLGVVTTDKIDASAFTGNLAMVTGTVAAGGINILGGSGTDTLWGGAAADIISGGAGVDRIQGVAAGGANQADVLTGGAGIDTFVFQDDFAANASISNVTFGTLTKISDFVAGTDKISLIDTAGAFTSITLGTAQTQATAATLAAMAAAITAIGVSADGGAASAVVVTVSAGAVAGTYLYINDTAAGPVSVTNDTFIDLTGITGTLVATDFLFA